MSPGNPLVVCGMELIPVERVRIESGVGRGFLWFQAEKEVAALVYRGPDGVRALDAKGREMQLKELAERFPELSAWIESLIRK